MKTGICQLCLQEKLLCKKSHIIPAFMYQNLLDKDEYMLTVEFEGNNQKVSKQRSGEYESDILCKNCEGLISIYENYGAKVLYGGSLGKKEPRITTTLYKEPSGVEYTQCNGVNYTKLKLFLLSILWKASISNRDYFENVDLTEHQEIIRIMILNNNPGKSNDYPILIFSFLKASTISEQIIIHPYVNISREGITFYNFQIAGFMYQFYINNTTVSHPEDILACTISEDNRLKIIHSKRDLGDEMIRKKYGLANKQL